MTMPYDFAKYIDTNVAWAIMESSKVGTEVANLYIMDMPDSPDTCVAVYQYGGVGPLQTFSNNMLIRKPRLQIMVRDPRSNIALDKINEIWELIVGVKEQSVNGNWYHKTVAQGEPEEIGVDSKNRVQFTCNFEIWKKG